MTSKKKDLYNLADGWLELESDPGLFTLLLEDMGVEGTQVRSQHYSQVVTLSYLGGGDLRPSEGAAGGGGPVLRSHLPIPVD